MGIFRNCEGKQKDPSFSKTFTLMEVLKDRLSSLKIPVVYGMSFGHVKDKFTIPFGALAELDADKQTFTLLEKAVSIILKQLTTKDTKFITKSTK